MIRSLRGRNDAGAEYAELKNKKNKDLSLELARIDNFIGENGLQISKDVFKQFTD